jgi:zinc protease
MVHNRRTFILVVCFFSLVFLNLLQVDLPAMPPVQRTVLPNGLVMLHSEDHSLPFITCELLIDAGSRRDPTGEEGLAYLTARGILLGTSTHTAAELNEELDFIAAHLSASAGRDFSTVSLRVMKKDLEKGLNIFHEVLTQPGFPQEEIDHEVEKTLAAIQAEEDQPEDVAEKAYERALFLTSPYGHPVEGTRESLPKITREALRGFHKNYYLPNNSVLAIVGDVTPEEVKKEIIPFLEKWGKGDVPEENFKKVFAKGPETIKVDRQITQANIILGNPGISRDNPDYYAVSVMNYILGGGGFASRLLKEIRNKKGLAYSVYSYFDYGKYPGSFQVVLQTKNASAREAVSLAIEQTKRIREKQVSEEELEGAKKYLVGSYPLRIDTQEKLATFLVQVEYYGLGMDYQEKYATLIRSVTREDVLRVAKTYLHPDEFILVVVGNQKEAGITDNEKSMEIEKGP